MLAPREHRAVQVYRISPNVFNQIVHTKIPFRMDISPEKKENNIKSERNEIKPHSSNNNWAECKYVRTQTRLIFNSLLLYVYG